MVELPPFHPERPGLVRPVRVDPRGQAGPTRAQARSSSWRRTSHGWYLPAEVSSVVPEQRIVEAAAVLPDGYAVTGWAALRWLGARRWFDGRRPDGSRRPVTLVTGSSDVKAQAGIAVSQERLDPRQVVVVDGLAVTMAARSVCFEMRYAADARRAARILSMAAYDDVVSIDEADAFATPGLNGWTGVPRCRAGILLASESCWSPTELDMALVWQLDGERPRPEANLPLFDLRGRHLLTPDLIDPLAGVAGEYEGDVHLDRAQRARDIRREALSRDIGLEVVIMTAADRDDPYPFLGRLYQAYARAEAHASRPRRWTPEAPPWWVPTRTVAQRRALTDDQRRRFLAYRSA